jgi:glucuronate isomerase
LDRYRWDSIGDFSQAKALAKFLGRLDEENKLAKTILYNLNPADNEVMGNDGR